MFHKFFIKNFISKYIDFFIGTSISSSEYMKDYEVFRNKISILDIGIDTTIFNPGNEKKKSDTSDCSKWKVSDEKTSMVKQSGY